MKGIKEVKHFSFAADHPGVVLMRKEWEGPTTELGGNLDTESDRTLRKLLQPPYRYGELFRDD